MKRRNRPNMRIKNSGKTPRLPLVLASAAALSLTACKTSCPEYPKMSLEAKEELDRKCQRDDGSFYPSCQNLEIWLGDIDKLREQLEN